MSRSKSKLLPGYQIRIPTIHPCSGSPSHSIHNYKRYFRYPHSVAFNTRTNIYPCGTVKKNKNKQKQKQKQKKQKQNKTKQNKKHVNGLLRRLNWMHFTHRP